jgi:hypothetical protein
LPAESIIISEIFHHFLFVQGSVCLVGEGNGFRRAGYWRSMEENPPEGLYALIKYITAINAPRGAFIYNINVVGDTCFYGFSKISTCCKQTE